MYGRDLEFVISLSKCIQTAWRDGGGLEATWCDDEIPSCLARVNRVSLGFQRVHNVRSDPELSFASSCGTRKLDWSDCEG